jgi:Interferon-induced transmembrane protein
MSNPDWTGAEPGSQNQLVGPMGQYPSYGYQSQYGAYPGPAAPQYGAYPGPAAPQYGAWQPQPTDYRAWVIAALVGGVLFSLLIGMPLGLIAQRNSRRVRGMWESGDHDGALRASRSARSWVIASMVFDVLGLLLVIVLFSHSGQPTS